MSDENEEAALYAAEVAAGPVPPRVVMAVIARDVLHIIAGAGDGASLSGAEIAVQIPTSNPAAGEMVDRMLRLLACHSVVDCSLRGAERMYGLNPVSKFLTKKNDGGVSFAHLCLMNQDKVSMQSWYVVFFLKF